MAWSVDRLGRSLQDLVGFLSELHALGIDLFLHQQGLDTTTPAGKAMFQMMGVCVSDGLAGWGGGIRTSASEIVPDGRPLSCGAESGSRSCADPRSGRVHHLPSPQGTTAVKPAGHRLHRLLCESGSKRHGTAQRPATPSHCVMMSATVLSCGLTISSWFCSVA